MELNDKCRTCLLRYQCEGIQEHVCKMGGHIYYAQDNKAMAIVKEQKEAFDMELEGKCKTCQNRYSCNEIQNVVCQTSDNKLYEQDDKAVLKEENEKLKIEIARLLAELKETRKQLVSICSKSMTVLRTQDAADTLVFKYAFVYSRELEHADASQIAEILLNEFVNADRKRREKENGQSR